MPIRRKTVVFVSMLLVVACVTAVEPLRTPPLRAMGRFLVATKEPRQADVIVLSVDARGAEVLEATDLIHQHVATRIAMFADPPDAVDREFQRRGVPYFNAAAVSLRQLRDLGVDAVEVIPRTVTGTDDESLVLPGWCSEHHYTKVVFISTVDHSRRTTRIMARATRGTTLDLTVHASQYSKFDPDAWWQSRAGIRTEIIEIQKLLVDILMHPLS